jgi:two-component system CheB/CheR fusion protein
MQEPAGPPPELLLQFLRQTLEYAVVVLDPDGTIVGWLGAAKRVFGYRREEIIGSPIARLFTAQDIAMGLDRQELAIASAAGRSMDDRWHLRSDGTAIWISGSVEAIRRPDGQLAGFVKIGRDRTDLRSQLDSLANEVAAAHADAQRTKTFLRTLGHELRNPLSPLQMAAHVIQRTSERAVVERAVDTILAQTATISRLADDLMEATRLDSGQTRLRLARVDLRVLAQQAADSFQALAAEKGLAIDVVQPASPLVVDADVPRLQQVLLNLLSNALKYTPPGGRVWLKSTQEGSEVLLRVEDTGIGIAPDVLPRIFDLFTREATAVESDPHGLGIGLAMVRQIVSLHGGSVQARSPGRDRGTEFTIRLPAV